MKENGRVILVGFRERKGMTETTIISKTKMKLEKSLFSEHSARMGAGRRRL